MYVYAYNFGGTTTRTTIASRILQFHGWSSFQRIWDQRKKQLPHSSTSANVSVSSHFVGSPRNNLDTIRLLFLKYPEMIPRYHTCSIIVHLSLVLRTFSGRWHVKYSIWGLGGGVEKTREDHGIPGYHPWVPLGFGKTCFISSLQSKTTLTLFIEHK